MTDTLMTQKEAAAMLRVSVAYLRASDCPKVLLPGNGPQRKPLVRYRRADIDRWLERRRQAPLGGAYRKAG